VQRREIARLIGPGIAHGNKVAGGVNTGAPGPRPVIWLRRDEAVSIDGNLAPSRDCRRLYYRISLTVWPTVGIGRSFVRRCSSQAFDRPPRQADAVADIRRVTLATGLVLPRLARSMVAALDW
jgi:hypothetical protein